MSNGFFQQCFARSLSVVLIVMYLVGCAIDKPQPFTLGDNKSLRMDVGDQFPVIGATSLDGRYVPLSKPRKKLIVMYGGFCDYCKNALEGLSKSDRVVRKEFDVIVFEMATGKSQISLVEAPKNKNIYIVISPPHFNWSEAKISAVPTFFTVSSEGMILNKYQGWHGDDDQKFSWISAKN